MIEVNEITQQFELTINEAENTVVLNVVEQSQTIQLTIQEVGGVSDVIDGGFIY